MLITQDSLSFNSIFIQLTIFFPKPNFLFQIIKHTWSIESIAFSISNVARRPVFKISDNSKMSDIISPSLIILFSAKAVWFEEINDGKVFLLLRSKTFKINLASMFNKEMGLRFLMKCLRLSFCSTSFITG